MFVQLFVQVSIKENIVWHVIIIRIVFVKSLFWYDQFSSDRLMARSFGVFFVLRLHRPLNKQLSFRFETTYAHHWDGAFSWPWFNIKMSSYQYRISRCGDKTILRPLISTMGFPILVRWHLYIESGPCTQFINVKILCSETPKIYPRFDLSNQCMYIYVDLYTIPKLAYVIIVPSIIFFVYQIHLQWCKDLSVQRFRGIFMASSIY